jgi:hypothetical protein
MKNSIRIIAVLGAVALVLALGVTAFASSSNHPSTAPAAATVSPSDDPKPEPTETQAEDHGQVRNAGDDQVENQVGDDDNGDVEGQDDNGSSSHDQGQSGNDDEGDSGSAQRLGQPVCRQPVLSERVAPEGVADASPAQVLGQERRDVHSTGYPSTPLVTPAHYWLLRKLPPEDGDRLAAEPDAPARDSDAHHHAARRRLVAD